MRITIGFMVMLIFAGVICLLIGIAPIGEHVSLMSVGGLATMVGGTAGLVMMVVDTDYWKRSKELQEERFQYHQMRMRLDKLIKDYEHGRGED